MTTCRGVSGGPSQFEMFTLLKQLKEHLPLPAEYALMQSTGGDFLEGAKRVIAYERVYKELNQFINKWDDK